MAWGLPPTFVDGVTVTASQLNLFIASLNETAVAKATTAGGYYVGTGVNTVAERTPSEAYVGATETTTSSTFADLTSGTAGPTLTVTTGPTALVLISAAAQNNTVNGDAYMGFDITGATTIPAGGSLSLIVRSSTANARQLASFCALVPLTAGSNTFTAKYQVSSGTTGTYAARRIDVLPF